MADILIRGMEMPKKDEILVFDEWHGKVYARSTANIGTRRHEVVSLPEGHGDLMDKAAFETDIKNRYCTGCDNYKGLKCKACWVDDMLGEVEDVPTIIEAEGGEADGN